jgi:hypothetical protein
MAERTIVEIIADFPPDRVRKVPAGSLARNHVGFFRDRDGIAYVLWSVSPSERYGIAEQRNYLDYEDGVA